MNGRVMLSTSAEHIGKKKFAKNAITAITLAEKRLNRK